MNELKENARTGAGVPHIEENKSRQMKSARKKSG